MKFPLPLLTLLLMLLPPLVNAQEFEQVSPKRQQIHEQPVEKLSHLERLEDTLVYLADSMYFSALDESRVDGSYEFIRVFKSLLKDPASFKAPLQKLKEKISLLEAPDHSFRIYNWEVVRNNVERRYYATIQFANGKLQPLIDISDQVIRGGQDSVFTAPRWFGALYYNMLSREADGHTCYFLLGWNGNSMNSDRKLIEVLTLDDKGHLQFGAPVFDLLDRGKHVQAQRMIVEYEKGSRLSMNYEADEKRIILDHCESRIGDPAKRYTYIPDGTYDGLQWNGQQWVMQENAVQITILKDGEAPVDKPVQR